MIPANFSDMTQSQFKELFHQLLKEEISNLTPVKATPPIEVPEICVLVTVTCGAHNHNGVLGGHEIMKFPLATKYPALVESVRTQFMNVQDGNAKARSNIHACIWSKDHKVNQIKAVWKNATPVWEGDVPSETILTEGNCENVLSMINHRGATDTLVVNISVPNFST